MKIFAKSTMLIVAIALSGSAMSQEIHNWLDSSGSVVKSGTDLCWRDSYWTPATAAPGCDGAIVPKPKEVAAPAPKPPVVVAAPKPPVVKPPVVKPPVNKAPLVTKVTYSSDAFFDFDRSTLKPAGKAALDKLIEKVKNIKLEVIIAVGHTDSIGSNAYNQKLSVRRAESVKAYLISKGIDKNRLYTEGKGKAQPVADNKTAAGRSKNRRVEVEVVGTRNAQ